MQITREEFAREALSLCSALRTLHDLESDDSVLDQWTVQGEMTSTTGIYLVHPPVLRQSGFMREGVEDLETDGIIEDNAVEQDVDTSMPRHSSGTEWRFSIVYSDTWSAPVLYFTVQRLNGSPCFRSEVLDALNAKKQVAGETWDFLSQEEHPVTGIPSFFLHPCQTSERLKLLHGERITKPTTTILLSWMTMIFPAVGYRMPPATFARLRDYLTHQPTQAS